MKRRKIENFIRLVLVSLPLIIVLIQYLIMIVTSHHHDTTYDISALYDVFENVFGNATTGLIYAPIYYLLNDVINIGSNLASCVSYYVQYIVIIEFVYIIYSLMVFIPRACSSLLSKGVRSE